MAPKRGLPPSVSSPEGSSRKSKSARSSTPDAPDEVKEKFTRGTQQDRRGTALQELDSTDSGGRSTISAAKAHPKKSTVLDKACPPLSGTELTLKPPDDKFSKHEAKVAKSPGNDDIRKPVPTSKRAAECSDTTPATNTSVSTSQSTIAVKEAATVPTARPSKGPKVSGNNPFSQLLAEVNLAGAAARERSARAAATTPASEKEKETEEGEVTEEDEPDHQVSKQQKDAVYDRNMVAKPAQRRVNLSNLDDVDAIVSLLKHELHVIRTKGVRAKNMLLRRKARVVQAEITLLLKHKAILTKVRSPTHTHMSEHRADLLSDEVTESFLFITPAYIAPQYTSGGVSLNDKHKIEVSFGITTWIGVASFIMWLEHQVQELKTSPLHYKPGAEEEPTESKFLGDVRDMLKKARNVRHWDELFEEALEINDWSDVIAYTDSLHEQFDELKRWPSHYQADAKEGRRESAFLLHVQRTLIDAQNGHHWTGLKWKLRLPEPPPLGPFKATVPDAESPTQAKGSEVLKPHPPSLGELDEPPAADVKPSTPRTSLHIVEDVEESSIDADFAISSPSYSVRSEDPSAEATATIPASASHGDGLNDGNAADGYSEAGSPSFSPS